VSLISAVKTYLLTYTGLESGTPMWVNHLNAQPTGYSIVPLPGPTTIEEYISGGSMEAFPFAFQIVESTADDAQRLDNIAFGETFAAWLKSQTKAGTLPTLGTGQTAYSIEATTWGHLFEQGDSETGIYQISCQLLYEQAA
jgi:hypothetical protein